jgi:hypothetical protein
MILFFINDLGKTRKGTIPETIVPYALTEDKSQEGMDKYSILM